MLTEVSPDKAGNSTAASQAAPARSAWWARLLARLPLGVLYGVAGVLGWLAFHVYPYRERVVRENLAKAFPQFDEAQLREVIRRYYLGFAQMLVEIIKSVSMPADEIRRRVRIVNLEAPRALLAQGQSVLLVAAHQCNWEWMLLALSLELGYPLDAAYKPLVDNWAEREMKKGAHPLRQPPGARQGAAAGHPQASRRGARRGDGGGPGADHQRAQVLDALPRPRHRVLHGSRGDRARHALSGVLHRHAPPRPRLLRDGVPAAGRGRAGRALRAC